jgi:hypothetical protein
MTAIHLPTASLDIVTAPFNHTDHIAHVDILYRLIFSESDYRRATRRMSKTVIWSGAPSLTPTIAGVGTVTPQLTTSFTPPVECFNFSAALPSATITNNATATNTTTCYLPVTSSCFPDSFWAATLSTYAALYSPRLCPSGYSFNEITISDDTIAKQTTSIATCCPG